MPKAKRQGWLAVTARMADAPLSALGQLRGWLGKRTQRDVKMRSAQLLLTSSVHHDDFREMTFTFAVIALAAKLAKADGEATRNEFLAFREAFPMPANEHEKISRLFDMALRDEAAAIHHARRIATLFPVSTYRRLLRDLLARLVRVAMADGRINKVEEELLSQIGEVFGLRRRECALILRKPHAIESAASPYAILGVTPADSEADIRRSYLQLMRENHPDSIQAQGGSQEAVLLAGRQVAQLSAAYRAIRLERRVE